MMKCKRCDCCFTRDRKQRGSEYAKCPRCGFYNNVPYELHPIGSEPIDFSELNLDDPSVLRMYFGRKEKQK